MRVGAAMSRTVDGGLAAAEAADAAAQHLDGDACRLAVVFATAQHTESLAAVGAAVDARLGPEALIGGVAQGVVGPAHEVEDGPAVSVWASSFDRGEVRPFRTWATPASSGGMAVVGWPDTRPRDVTVLLADPHSYPAAQVVGHLGRQRPGHPVVGGMLTSGERPGRLLLRAPGESTDVEVHDDGGVGLVLRDVGEVRTLVSQGCRPVGEPLVVTGAEGNLITELAGEPAAEQLRRIFSEVDDDDRLLMQRGLHVGIVADEYRDRFETGDFLIRAVMGADTDTGAVAIGDHPEIGQTMQFQVRDAASADADLRATLEDQGGPATGALLFTCNGRGRRLFGTPDHDVAAVTEHLTDQVAGAFCAGEIGPIGTRSFLHGFTASLAVFAPDDEPR